MVLSPPIPGSITLQLLVQVQGTFTCRHQFSSETPHAWISFLKEGESPISQPYNVAALTCSLTWPTNQTLFSFSSRGTRNNDGPPSQQRGSWCYDLAKLGGRPGCSLVFSRSQGWGRCGTEREVWIRQMSPYPLLQPKSFFSASFPGPSRPH